MESAQFINTDTLSLFPREYSTAVSASALLSLALFFSPIASADNGLIEIEQVVWTDRIDPNTREFGQKFEDTAPKKPLYLWMQVKGNQEALTRLEAEGKLPVRHKWFRKTLTSVNPEGIMQVVDSIPVPAARIEVFHKLKSEVAALNYFNWRTWSMKENIRRGQWRVTVVYADSSPVLCGVSREPCEFFIQIR